jgi:hypothetical protein
MSPEKITLAMLTKPLTLEYLEWIENSRAGCAATRNQWLSSIRGFVKFVNPSRLITSMN